MAKTNLKKAFEGVVLRVAWQYSWEPMSRVKRQFTWQDQMTQPNRWEPPPLISMLLFWGGGKASFPSLGLLFQNTDSFQKKVVYYCMQYLYIKVNQIEILNSWAASTAILWKIYFTKSDALNIWFSNHHLKSRWTLNRVSLNKCKIKRK